MTSERKGRQPDDLSKLPFTVEQLKLKLRRRYGVNTGRHKGAPISTKIVRRDIALISGIHDVYLQQWMAGKIRFGVGRLVRLNAALDLANAGLVTKTCYGTYVYHDTPAVAPIKEARVSLSGSGIFGEISTAKPVKRMPDFSKLFG